MIQAIENRIVEELAAVIRHPVRDQPNSQILATGIRHSTERAKGGGTSRDQPRAGGAMGMRWIVEITTQHVAQAIGFSLGEIFRLALQ